MSKCVAVLTLTVFVLLAAVACGSGKTAADGASAAVISQVAGAQPALDAALLQLEKSDAAMRDGRRDRAARALAEAGLKLNDARLDESAGAPTGDALRLADDYEAYVQAQMAYLTGLSSWIADASPGAAPPSDLRAKRAWCDKMRTTLDADLAAAGGD